mmetsp:Transcript_14155/g.48781  ORF Transcript_14155/g.48781 Transcript_14155/m.48781 type:complete len:446 (-) Transcript_14155:44-1381(-)
MPSSLALHGDPKAAKVLRILRVPPAPAEDAGFRGELAALLERFPAVVRAALQDSAQASGRDLYDLTEVYVQVGRRAEAVFQDAKSGGTRRVFITESACDAADLDLFASMFAEDGGPSHKRKGIEGTLHRLSVITHPSFHPERVIGVAARIGRVVQGTVERMARFLVEDGLHKSVLLVGRPGVGKTTVLRELSRLLSDQLSLNVVVVDKTCEIAGDGLSPHPSIGSARWMPVSRPGLQAEILREAVENQSPHVVIVDELSTVQEVDAARTVTQRGVRLVATVHGTTLPEVMNDKDRSMLLGGQHTLTLSDAAARQRADQRKSVNARRSEPAIGCAIELHERERWVYHPSVKAACDAYLNGEPCDAQLLTPGKSVSVAALPVEDRFEYCLDCGAGRGTCALHRPAPAPAPAGGAAAPRQTAGGQRSGACRACGQVGHFARDCPERRA